MLAKSARRLTLFSLELSEWDKVRALLEKTGFIDWSIPAW
ncbi:hypothetical protein B932_3166 [Gluconobacter oxydans H24]|nr:hypothetical protein B932_3166 [Gluconobacter oxydans H24]